MYVYIYIYIWYCRHIYHIFHIMLVSSTQHLNKNIATSHALYTYLAISVDKCKTTKGSQFFMSSLCKLAVCVCPHIERVGVFAELNTGAGIIHIRRDGQVSGFAACMKQGMQPCVYRPLYAEPWLEQPWVEGRGAERGGGRGAGGRNGG